MLRTFFRRIYKQKFCFTYEFRYVLSNWKTLKIFCHSCMDICEFRFPSEVTYVFLTCFSGLDFCCSLQTYTEIIFLCCLLCFLHRHFVIFWIYQGILFNFHGLNFRLQAIKSLQTLDLRAGSLGTSLRLLF